MKVSDQLRKAIRDTGESVSMLSKKLPMSDTTITRFLNGSKMTTDNVDALCEFFGLELRPVDATKTKDKVKAPAVPAVDWTKAEPKKKPRDEGRERRK